MATDGDRQLAIDTARARNRTLMATLSRIAPAF